MKVKIVDGLKAIDSVGSFFSGFRRRLAEKSIDYEKDPFHYAFEMSKMLSWQGNSECDFVMNSYVLKDYNHTTLRPLENYYIITCLRKRLAGMKLHASWKYVPEDIMYNKNNMLGFVYKLIQSTYYYLVWHIEPSLFNNDMRVYKHIKEKQQQTWCLK